MKAAYLLTALVASLLIQSCYSTKIESSWREPSTTIVRDSINKILAVALVKNEGVRRQIEDEMAKQGNGKIFPSYNYLIDVSSQQEAAITQKLKADGFDIMVIMRLVDVDETTTYVPGSYPTYYGGWYGYYGYSYPGYYNPGYVTTDQEYRVETNFYQLPENKLLWSGLTSTMNPSGIESAVEDIAYVIRSQMNKEGFLK